MSNTRNPIVAAFLAGAILFATLLLSACGTGVASDAEPVAAAETAAVPVEVALPSRADVHATYASSTAIASDSDAPVVAKVAGEVVELLVEEGDQVTAGQALLRLDGQRLRLEMLSAKANLERARKEFERNKDLHRRGLVSAALFEGLKYDLDALQATYQLKRLNYGYSTVRATISGIVSSRDIKLGENLTAGQVAYRITDTAELLAYLQVPQAELSKIGVGQSATLTVASTPSKQFPATIIRISPTIDIRDGTFRATARIDNANGELAPGMFGRFRISYETHENALVIPQRALLDEDDVMTVYVVKDDQVLRRTIEVGIIDGDHAEVLSGLSEGEQVVVVGQSGLRDGSKVLASVPETGRYTG